MQAEARAQRVSQALLAPLDLQGLREPQGQAKQGPLELLELAGRREHPSQDPQVARETRGALGQMEATVSRDLQALLEPQVEMGQRQTPAPRVLQVHLVRLERRVRPVETVKQQTQGRRGLLERQDRLEALVLQAARGRQVV